MKGDETAAMQKISLHDIRFERNRKLHSREHVLADDLAREMREPKRFAAYLGIAKRYYEGDLRRLARRVREKEDLPLDARGKYFFAALRGLTPTPAAKKKRPALQGEARSQRRKKRKETKRNHGKSKRGVAARNRKKAAQGAA